MKLKSFLVLFCVVALAWASSDEEPVEDFGTEEFSNTETETVREKVKTKT
jgi:hypothetical protein